MQGINQIKQRAREILLKETFSYIDKKMYNAYSVLAKENAQVLGLRHPERILFFLQNGTVYPNRTPNGQSVYTLQVLAPILHYTLIDRMHKIQSTLEDAGYTQVKNFYSAIISNSFNNIVLDTFVPQVLLSKLKDELYEAEYKVIDLGSMNQTPAQSIRITECNIQMIKEHYRETIVLLKDILMERFLLQG